MDTRAAPALPHTHAAGLGVCLDLVNTLELVDGRPDDHLASPDDAIAFLAGAGLAHEADLRRQVRREGGDAWLARVRAVRTALRDCWDATVEGRAPAARTIGILNAVLDHVARHELRAVPGGVAVGHRHAADDPAGEALARVAAPLADAIGAGETHRFRVCANDGCRWVFEDASRAGRRRWCDMATCGNRAKVRRYRSRRRDGPAAGSPGAPAARPSPGA